MIGYTQIVTAATTYPITVEEAKQHLRLVGNDDDTLLADYLASVRDWLGREVAGGITLLTTTYDWFLPRIDSDRLRPPHTPLASVTTFSYRDSANATQTLTEGTTFAVHTPTNQPGWLSLIEGVSWPTTYINRDDAVTIRYVAGYTAATIPPRAKHATRLALGGFFEFRENMLAGTTITEIPDSVSRIMRSMDYGFYG